MINDVPTHARYYGGTPELVHIDDLYAPCGATNWNFYTPEEAEELMSIFEEGVAPTVDAPLHNWIITLRGNGPITSDENNEAIGDLVTELLETAVQQGHVIRSMTVDTTQPQPEKTTPDIVINYDIGPTSDPTRRYESQSDYRG